LEAHTSYRNDNFFGVSRFTFLVRKGSNLWFPSRYFSAPCVGPFLLQRLPQQLCFCRATLWTRTAKDSGNGKRGVFWSRPLDNDNTS